MQKQYDQGQVIFREGEDSDSAYIIESGTIEIFKRSEKGTVLLAQLGKGEIFGEMGVIDERPRSAYAAAATDVTLTVLSRDSFGTVMQSQPQEVVLVVKTLMERLRESNASLSKMVARQADALKIKDDAPPPVNRVNILPLSDEVRGQLTANGVSITSLPYRVGSIPEGAEPNPLDWNNLFIKGADPQVMARNHFAIQRGEGGLYVMDRGSKTGTIVNGTTIGGVGDQHKAELRHGDNEVIAGPPSSPYRFCVVWE